MCGQASGGRGDGAGSIRARGVPALQVSQSRVSSSFSSVQTRHSAASACRPHPQPHQLPPLLLLHPQPHPTRTSARSFSMAASCSSRLLCQATPRSTASSWTLTFGASADGRSTSRSYDSLSYVMERPARSPAGRGRGSEGTGQGVNLRLSRHRQITGVGCPSERHNSASTLVSQAQLQPKPYTLRLKHSSSPKPHTLHSTATTPLQ